MKPAVFRFLLLLLGGGAADCRLMPLRLRVSPLKRPALWGRWQEPS